MQDLFHEGMKEDLKMKKIISLVLMVAMLLTALPAMADNVRTSGDFQYTIKGNGTATIVRYTGPVGDVIFPNLIDGYTITSIGDSAFDYSDRSVNNKHGGTITLPNTITSIGEKAFFGFPFTTINLPDSLEYIGYGAFAGFVHDFRISNNHPYFAVIDGSLYNKAEKELLYGYSGGRSDVVIPEGIVSIGDYAYYNRVLWNFKIPSTVQRIGNYAYSGTSYNNRQEITLHEGLLHIGDYAFSNITGNSDRSFTLYLPASIQSIGEGAFKIEETERAMVSTKVFFSPDTNLEMIGTYAFGSDSPTEEFIEVYLDGHISEYGDYAFRQAQVRSMPKTVGKIGNYAFEESDLNLLSEIVIPSSCHSIGEGAFAGASLYYGTSITIENGIETISSKAFFGVKSQEPIYLPESLQDIATDAFSKDAIFVVEKGTYAMRWADDNAFTYTINGEEQNLDWLNN